MPEKQKNARQPKGWTDEARAASAAAHRRRQAEHDLAVGDAIRRCRAAGLSWRRTAEALGGQGVPPPRGAAATGAVSARWHHLQVRRIARRLGIQ